MAGAGEHVVDWQCPRIDRAGEAPVQLDGRFIGTSDKHGVSEAALNDALLSRRHSILGDVARREQRAPGSHEVGGADNNLDAWRIGCLCAVPLECIPRRAVPDRGPANSRALQRETRAFTSSGSAVAVADDRRSGPARSRPIPASDRMPEMPTGGRCARAVRRRRPRERKPLVIGAHSCHRTGPIALTQLLPWKSKPRA